MQWGPHFNSMQVQLKEFQNFTSRTNNTTQNALSYIYGYYEVVPVSKLQNTLEYLSNVNSCEEEVNDRVNALIRHQYEILSGILPKILYSIFFSKNASADFDTSELIHSKNRSWASSQKNLPRKVWVLESICRDIINADLCSKKMLYDKVLESLKMISGKMQEKYGDKYLETLIYPAIQDLCAQSYVGEMSQEYIPSFKLVIHSVESQPNITGNRLIRPDNVYLAPISPRPDVSGSGNHTPNPDQSPCLQRQQIKKRGQ